jgi:hypothetical protein
VIPLGDRVRRTQLFSGLINEYEHTA